VRAMRFAELAFFEHLQRLVGQLEQADQVGDGQAGCGPTRRANSSFGQAEILDQGRSRLSPPRPGSGPSRTMFLDQRRLEALRPRPARGATAGTFLEPCLLGGPAKRRSPATSS